MAPPHHDAQHDEVALHDTCAATTVRVSPSNIDGCIHVTVGRALLTLFSLFLVLSDIPRTGLIFRVDDYFERIPPAIVLSWGPYEYHVVHLNATKNHTAAAAPASSIQGSVNSEPLQVVDNWGYKFDTLSIPQRALAAQLNVSSYPPCVLYRERCQDSTLELSTVFHMVDDLVSSITSRFFAKDPLLVQDTSPYLFATQNVWVDRLHHYLYSLVTPNAQTRFHSVHYFASTTTASAKRRRLDPLQVCNDQNTTKGISRTTKPIFCSHPLAWHCDHPMDPTGKRTIPIWDHIAIRYNDLQRRYSDVDLEMVLLTTGHRDGPHLNDFSALPSAQYAFDTVFITTWIRGRRCSLSGSSGSQKGSCETVFIDDFRYERSTLESSDTDHWLYYTVVLRGVSQAYVWLRVCLLVCGCYYARANEPMHHSISVTKKWIVTIKTVLKIPGHFIAYGSWLPMVGYAVAHFFDSCLVHAVGEFTSTSTEGFYTFRPFAYILATALQMRNTWLLVLTWKLGVWLYGYLLANGCQPGTTTSRTQGVVGVRSCWIICVSWLTTLSFARSLRFRDTDILSFIEIPRQKPINTLRESEYYRFFNNYGLRFDIKCSFVALIIIICVGKLFGWLARCITLRPTTVLTCRSFYVPYSAGSLWPMAVLNVVWFYDFTHHHHHHSREKQQANHTYPRMSSLLAAVAPMPMRPTSSADEDRMACPVCNFHASPIHWRATQGCLHHEPVFDIHRRTKAIWSMVRLTNIAAMTDPIVLFQLYVVGRELFLYRVHSIKEPPYLMLLPTRMATAKDDDEGDDDTNAPQTRLELVKKVDSRQVPWHVLVNCG